jgi:hypothetical protein
MGSFQEIIKCLNQYQASSWIQSITAFGGIIALIYTLKLQRKATNAQVIATNEQLKLNKFQIAMAERDNRRFLMEVKPVISLKYTYKKTSKSGIIELNVQKNDAHRVYIENRSSKAIQIEGLYLPTDRVLGSKFSLRFNVIDLQTLTTWEFNHAPFIFILFFQDAFGTKYTQTVIKSFDDEEFKKGPAEQVTDDPEWLKKAIDFYEQTSGY